MSFGSGAAPAVDIVVCNHNYGEFVADAVDSACGQSLPGVRVIVVDDGSTDASRRVLSGYRDRVELVLKENGGQASALNAGLERCRGEVVLLLDADDVLRPDAAQRVSGAFDADPRLAKVQFRMAVIDAEGRPTGAVKPTPHLAPPAGDLREAELDHPFDLPWLPGGGTAFRVEPLRRILPIPEAEYPRCGADWYLVHLSALLGSAAALDEVCAEYRVHGGNAYELGAPRLDLAHVRETIEYARATARSLARLADQLGLARPERILSVSDLANRLISLRLEPRLHPIRGDRRPELLRDASRAIGRRSDVSPPMRALFAAWFAVVALAPRRLVRPLAELFLFPERRRSLNALLGRLHR
jgi:glycosyltransferase involved in cell wall biosynthesis